MSIPEVRGRGNVSRKHARIVFQDGRVYIRDADSKDGTYVNDGASEEQVQGTGRRELKPGYRVRLGCLYLEVIKA